MGFALRGARMRNLLLLVAIFATVVAVGCWDARRNMQQVQLWFPTLEEATAYAEKEGWQYTVEMPNSREIRPKAYADNFAFNRVGRWTH